MTTKITKKKFIKALDGTAGVMLSIANRLGVTRQAVYKFCWEYPEMMELRRQEEEKIIDAAENALFARVEDKEQWAVKYLLATKGKKRGYTEKQEIEITNADTLTLEEKEKEIKRLLNESK